MVTPMKEFYVLLQLSVYINYAEQALNTVQPISHGSSSDLQFVKVNMTIKDQAFDVDVIIFEAISCPLLHLAITQTSRGTVKKWIDKSISICDLKKRVIENPYAYMIIDLFNKHANFTVQCNYSPGTYTIRNFRPGSAATPFSPFVYRPNSYLMANVSFLSANGKDLMRIWCNMKVVRVK